MGRLPRAGECLPASLVAWSKGLIRCRSPTTAATQVLGEGADERARLLGRVGCKCHQRYSQLQTRQVRAVTAVTVFAHAGSCASGEEGSLADHLCTHAGGRLGRNHSFTNTLLGEGPQHQECAGFATVQLTLPVRNLICSASIRASGGGSLPAVLAAVFRGHPSMQEVLCQGQDVTVSLANSGSYHPPPLRCRGVVPG